VIDTTPGRMKIAALLPHHPQIGHRLIEKALTKKEIGNLIDIVYRHCGQKATVIFADKIMGWASRKPPRRAFPSARTTSSSRSGRRRSSPKPLAGRRVRATVRGRPDHQGREVQQGR
jgi:hypothetical protein